MEVLKIIGEIILVIICGLGISAPIILLDMCSGGAETSKDNDDFWIKDSDGMFRGIKRHIIKLETTLSDEIASTGGFPYAKFLMEKLIGYSTKEILIYQKNFPDKLMIEMIPEFQRFLDLGGKIRVLYLNIDGYNSDLFENKLKGNIKVSAIRFPNNNTFNSAYFSGLSKREKWNYLVQNLKSDIVQEPGIQIFDRRGIRYQLTPSKDLKEFPSVYSFNKPETAMMWVEEFEKHFGSLT